MSEPAPPEAGPGLRITRLTPDLLDDLGAVLKGSWGASCWCLYPRYTDRQLRELPGDGPSRARRRAVMAGLAARPLAPGLLAHHGDRPVGWIAVAPRPELGRIVRARATPALDDAPVWVIPCVTVAPGARGRGVAVALIEAAAAYARSAGARIVEAYPRADGVPGGDRPSDDSVYFGTEALFTRAGFSVVRPPLPGLPANWQPRVAMRLMLDGGGPLP